MAGPDHGQLGNQEKISSTKAVAEKPRQINFAQQMKAEPNRAPDRNPLPSVPCHLMSQFIGCQWLAFFCRKTWQGFILLSIDHFDPNVSVVSAFRINKK